eukprot:gene12963-biopygen23012
MARTAECGANFGTPAAAKRARSLVACSRGRPNTPGGQPSPPAIYAYPPVPHARAVTPPPASLRHPPREKQQWTRSGRGLGAGRACCSGLQFFFLHATGSRVRQRLLLWTAVFNCMPPAVEFGSACCSGLLPHAKTKVFDWYETCACACLCASLWFARRRCVQLGNSVQRCVVLCGGAFSLATHAALVFLAATRSAYNMAMRAALRCARRRCAQRNNACSAAVCAAASARPPPPTRRTPQRCAAVTSGTAGAAGPPRAGCREAAW